MLTFAELDALLAATQGAAAVVMSEPEWEALFRPEPKPLAKALEGGRILYRGLLV